VASDFMRETMRPSRSASQVAPSARPPLAPVQFDVARKNITQRPTGQALERMCLPAVDLVAEQTSALHSHLHDCSPEYCGKRGEGYFREQLTAARVLTNEDEARLVYQAPVPMVSYVLPVMRELAKGASDAFALALAALAPITGCTLMPLGDGAGDLRNAGAIVAEAALDLIVRLKKHLSDHVLEDHERADLLAWVHDAKARLVVIENTILTAPRNQERRTAPRDAR
jgi:hypothetical protein